MDFSVSVFALLALAVVGAVILGGLVLSVVLLLSEKTRVAGVILLVMISLVGAMIVAVGAYLVPLRMVGDGSPPTAEPPSVYSGSPVESQVLAPEADQANQTDDPEAAEHGARSDRAEQPPADEQPVAPIAEPDANSEARRLLTGSTHRRLNT